MENDSYYSQKNLVDIQKTRLALKRLPSFVSNFIRGIEQNTTPSTRLSYTNDIEVFLNFLTEEIPFFKHKKMLELEVEDLNNVTSTNLEEFLSYLSQYEFNGKEYSNTVKTKARKFASVRAMLKFFFKKNMIISNVAEKVNSPKIREKAIIRLEDYEINKLLNEVETGRNLTKNQKSYHNITQDRDIALLSLFLGTGIRISELIGINIQDLDFNENAFTVTRKGGNRVILYFSEEVAKPLMKYLHIRLNNDAVSPEEKAFFVSIQGKRISARAVEKLVNKYTKLAVPLKHITPHKLRSTYGTNLYKQTGDIYIVADVLGHKDVNTTKKYYAAITDDIRKAAASKVKLRASTDFNENVDIENKSGNNK